MTKGKMMPNCSVKNFEIDAEKAISGSLIIKPFYTTERKYLLEISLKINTKKAT